MALGQLLINDFSGGLNDTKVAPLIGDNECQTATNVFVNNRGGVEKRYGFVNYDQGPANSPSANTILATFPSTNYASGVDQIYVIEGNSSGSNQFGPYYITAGNTGSAFTEATYSNGTATFTASSAIVTLATGTSEWLTQVKAGDRIGVSGGTDGGVILSVDSNTQVTLQNVWASGTTTAAYVVRKKMNTTNLPAAEMFNGNLHFSPGAGNEMYYITSAGVVRTVPSSPSGATVTMYANHKNYLFAGDTSSSHNGRIWWSSLLSATTSTSWPATNFVDVDPSSGALTGIISHNGLLYIFKSNGIWYLQGDVFDPSNPTYSLTKVVNPQGIGTFHRDSIKVFQDRIIFLGQDGLYSLDGINKITNISEHKIRTTIRSITNRMAPFSNGSVPAVAAAVYDNKYWMSYPTSGTVNNATLVMDANGAFTIHNTLVTTTSWAIANTSNKTTLVGFVASTSVASYIDATATNDGSSAISSTWTSKIFGFGDLSRTTHVYDVYVAYYNTTNQAATLTVYDDAGAVGSSAAHTFPGGSTQFITVQRFVIDRDTNGLYLSVTDNTSNKSFRIMGILIQYEKDEQGSGSVIT